MPSHAHRFDLQALNAMDCDAFVAALGPTFENSPWVARSAWSLRPFATIDALHEAMLDVVRRAPDAQQLAFLCGHPELAGREAQAGTMTTESVGEQGSAGLNALSREEMAEIQRLNRVYRERHGFPFIIAVRRSTKGQIFEALRSRAAESTEAERRMALTQIGLITRGRIDALLGASTSQGAVHA
ncbi:MULTISPECIES: 2-oxo-4-hydroxy-4-carboxy-5-ureidoimidazoline decarboxylase [unclassified Variovorax]|uniref:2-oxo-4-hydroxy-4-carboxy-5-ureidoimidazoline decarboxylase n=1 Tax=unclassified Variovorax TaxID=663243 RepID=UPI0032E7440F